MLKGKSVAATTLGCKVNQAETDSMLDMLSAAGADIVDFEEKADIYIVNTCSVTNIADKKSRQMLHRAKKRNPESIVIAAGCYVQSAKELLEQDESVDIVISNNKKKDITDIVNDYINVRKNEGGDAPADGEKKEYFVDISKETEYEEMGGHVPVGHTRAYVKIQDGCNQFCSYCIIPYARGRVRSRNPKTVIEEIEKIAKTGIKEVVITGIHIASYGKDFKEDYKLINLLEDINKIDGIERIRLGSIEPLLITEEFVERLKKLDKICHHFHLSLQSGCNETLKRMNRRYTTEQFITIVNRLRKAYSDVILTTDIIVGFPEESEEEFNKTYEFLEQIKFYKMHVFKYSPRKGTIAAKNKNQIDGNVKEERSKKLIELSDKNEKEYNESYIGKKVEVLFEEEKQGIYQGHTKNYILVKCKSTKNIENKILTVTCQKVENSYILGTL